ncbi:hypothetical protein [Methylobacterium sp. J-068]|uniref:hypothetical protein n=1 Tax=Methylobacterium sp. J-068 TaxID=2836649 RepID=UPI001FBA81F0|nr:hypothetical protein [Methylobacterium sp. J-068]MCJ2034247.1 hypothetical protein [Methylobacterium sp. J-068]
MRQALALLLCLSGSALAQSYPPPGVSASQLNAAVRAAMPAPATVMPPATALDGATGGAVAYARADHTHAARVQRTVMTTAADGTVTWTFARPIVCAAGKLPPISNMVEDTGSPVVVQVTGRAFTSDATAGTDTHTAVTIRAQRSQFLPAMLVSLAALLNFNVFGGSASGVKVNLWAADPTQ